MELEALYPFLRYALGAESEPPAVASAQDFADLYAMAHKQQVVGLFCRTLTAFPMEIGSPIRKTPQFARMLSAALKVEDMNLRVNEAARKLSACFAADSRPSCILKGQGLSLLYPAPSSRQPGDIDLWCPGKRSETLSFARKRWKIDSVVYHHCEAAVFKHPSTEIHFTPSWMFNPLYNARLQRYFKEQAPIQCANSSDELGLNIADVRFNSVYLPVHLFRHLIDEGICLKQLADYYLVLRHMPREQLSDSYKLLRSFGLARFAAGLMAVLQEIFHLDREHMLCNPDASISKRIIDEIKLGKSAGIDRREKPLHRVLRRSGHRISLLFSYPSEIIWAPAFKTIQFFWRLLFGYL